MRLRDEVEGLTVGTLVGAILVSGLLWAGLYYLVVFAVWVVS
jgi:hypothetical protein